MNKKRIIISSIIVLALSVLFHSVYDNFPNAFTSLFFPVNESIWEHNKMILLSYFVLACINKIFKKTESSSILSYLVTGIICIVLIDITFTPIYLYILKTKDNLPLTILIYIISIIASFIFKEKMPNFSSKYDPFGYLGFAIISFIFILLTFYPPKLPIFYDYSKGFYGVSK